MSNADPTRLPFVQMAVKNEQEAAFNRWYEDEYIPAFVRDVRGITRCRRFVTLSPDANGGNSYPTIYEFTSQASIERGMDVMESRETWRKAWKEWEQSSVTSISDNLFRTTTHVTGSANA
jgi:hypothetical protein